MQWNNITIFIILRPCTNKVFELEYINQVRSGKKFSFPFNSGLSCDIDRLSLILRLSSDLLLAKILKSQEKLRDCKGAFNL